MTEDRTYEGWSNYPTWAVNLWLSNDEGLYRATQELVAATIAGDEGPIAGSNWHVAAVAGELNEMVGELLPDLGATFAADLLGYAVGEVDWNELAEHWMPAKTNA